MTIRKNAFFAVTASLLLLSGVAVTGCSDKTKEAASNTVDGVGQDAQNHAVATGQAVDKAGEKVADASEKAAVATTEAAKETGQAVKNGAEYTGEAVGGAVKGVAEKTDDIGKAAKMTPLVKDALIKSKLDASTINVDTAGEADTVILKGTVKTAAHKTQAAQVAMSAIKGAGEHYKVKNELTVAP